jgi:hypothetical protein
MDSPATIHWMPRRCLPLLLFTPYPGHRRSDDTASAVPARLPVSGEGKGEIR